MPSAGWMKIAGRVLVVAAVVSAVLPLRFSHSQQQHASVPDPDATGFVIKKSVRRVVVDVVVSGMDHQTNMALGARDFTVSEDGVPQQVLSFEKHDFAGEPDYVPPKLPALPVDTFVDVPPGPERGALNVILLDGWDTSLDDQMIGRQQMLKFIREAPEGSRFAIFLLYNQLRLVQGFTSDKARLIAAAESHGTWPKVGVGSTVPLNELLQLADFLDRLPGRKNIFWLADRFPAASFAPDFFDAGVKGDGCRDRPGLTAYAEVDIQGLTDQLSHAQISVYPINLEGVIGGKCALLRYMDLDDFAKATGGHAFYSRNDLSDALSEAVEQGNSYYTLTYSPRNEKYDGRARTIQVAIDRQGFSLAYRRAYFGVGRHPRRS